MTEPNLDKILRRIAYWNGYDSAGEWERTGHEVKAQLEEYIANQVAKARIDEIHAWFDMPKHYPGEEYLDEPFAKAKCKTPKKITYYTLDSSFTYSLKERLATLNGVKNK